MFHIIAVQTRRLSRGSRTADVTCASSSDHAYVWHLRFMTYSYIALIVTGIDQFFAILPFTPCVHWRFRLPMLIGDRLNAGPSRLGAAYTPRTETAR